MLNARAVVVAAAALAGLVLLAAWWSLLSPTMSSDNSDSFGVRTNGYLGLLETLQELGAPAVRSVEPPIREGETDDVLVFLNPDQEMIDLEPAYLQSVRTWLRGGGRVVVALPDADEVIPFLQQQRRQLGEAYQTRNLLELLGLNGDVGTVAAERIAENSSVEAGGQPRAPWFSPPKPPAVVEVAVQCNGEWLADLADVRRLAAALDHHLRLRAGRLDHDHLGRHAVVGDGHVLGLDRAGPLERKPHQPRGHFILVRQLQRSIAVRVWIVGLVEQVPGQHAIVLAVAMQYVLNVRTQCVLFHRVDQHHPARALHPAAVMHARPRATLRAALRIRVPYAVEKHHQRANSVLRGNLQKPVDAIEESLPVITPRQVVQKHANGIETQRCRPT